MSGGNEYTIDGECCHGTLAGTVLIMLHNSSDYQ